MFVQKNHQSGSGFKLHVCAKNCIVVTLYYTGCQKSTVIYLLFVNNFGKITPLTVIE